MSTEINNSSSTNKSNLYLKLSIHDNDYWYIIERVSESLSEFFYFLDITPNILKNKLLQLKIYIQDMLYTTYTMCFLLKGRDKDEELTSRDYFEPDLEIVDYLDIPNWDNGENAFIPLFDADVIYR